MYSSNNAVDQFKNNPIKGYPSLPEHSVFTKSTSTVSASTTTANSSTTCSSSNNNNNNDLKVLNGDEKPKKKKSSAKLNIRFPHSQNIDNDSQILPIYAVDTHSICNSYFSLDKNTSAQSLLRSQSIRYANDPSNSKANMPAVIDEPKDAKGNSRNRLWYSNNKETRRNTANSELIDSLLDLPLSYSKAQYCSESEISCDSDNFHDISQTLHLSSHKNSRAHSRLSSKVISGKKSLINNSSISYLSTAINPLNDDSDLLSCSISSNNNKSDYLNTDKNHASNISLTFPSEKISKMFISTSAKQPLDIPNSFDLTQIEQNVGGASSHETYISLSTSPITALNPNRNENGIDFENQEQYSQFPRELTTLVPIKQIPPPLILLGMVVHDKGIIDEFGEISEFRSSSTPECTEDNIDDVIEVKSNDKGYINKKYERPQPVRKTRLVQLLEKYSKFSLDNSKAEQDFQLHQWESFFMLIALRKYPNLKKLSRKLFSNSEKAENDIDSDCIAYGHENNVEGLISNSAISEVGSNVKRKKILSRSVCENADCSLFSNYEDLIGTNASRLTKEELKQLKSLLVAKHKKSTKLSTKYNAANKMANLLSLTTNSGKSLNNSKQLLNAKNVSNQKWYTFGIPMKLRAKIWLAIAGVSSEKRSLEYAELISGKYLEKKPFNEEERLLLLRLVKLNERQIGLDYGRTMGNNVYFHNICERKERYLDNEASSQDEEIIKLESKQCADDKKDLIYIKAKEALSPGSQRLRDLLTAFVRKHPKLGYCQGMNLIAAKLILLFLDQQETYLFFEDLIINRLNTRVFSIDMQVIQKYVLLLLNKFMKRMTPKVYNALRTCGIDLQIHFVNWYITLCENIFPNKILFQVWDYLFCYPEPSERKDAPLNKQGIPYDRVLRTDIKFFKIIITVFAYFEQTLSAEELSDAEQMNIFLVRMKGYIVAQNFTSLDLWELHQKLFKNNNDLVNMDVLKQFLEY